MEDQHTHKTLRHYRGLLLMTIVSFACMYILMYAMVDTWTNVVMNINQFYMTLVMTAPMPVIMLLFMRGMYPRKKWNTLIIAASILCLLLGFLFIRKQTGVDDQQFLKSMIPHHAGAILMVEEANIQDTAVQRLARQIIESQQKEIDFMKAKLREIEE